MPFDPNEMSDPQPGSVDFDPGPWLLFAADLAQEGQMDRAESAYLDLLQRAPNFAIARFQLGLLQFTSARPAVALRSWAPLDLLPETHYLRLFTGAFACLAEDKFEATAALLREGIAQNTENPPLNQDMQMLLGKLQQAGFLPGEDGNGRKETPAASEQETSAHFLLSSYRIPPL